MDHQYSDMSYVPQHEHWMDRNNYSGQHHSPMEEYPQYGFASSPPMQPGFATSSIHPTRPTLQPLITPWPSVLASGHQQQQHQNVYTPQSLHSTPQQQQPPMQISPSANPHFSSHATATPRRTLTDNDRRKMCQYHEDFPTKKQTEIGELFGVERSTVSKVLRQKEKYLRTTTDPGHSPVKSSKKNKPDLDRALAKWAANQQSKGVRITDELIKNQARFFWHAAGNTSDLPVKIDSASWLEKFKQKNGLTPGGTPGLSDAGGDDSTFSPGDATPLSPEDALSRHVSPTAIAEGHTLRRQPSLGYDGLGIRGTATRAPLHSQSNTSLSSAFTADTAVTAFSSEDTSVGSPVISPDALHSSSSYFPASQTPIAPAPPPTRTGSVSNSADNSHRPRSSTFPLTSAADPYISPPQSANTSSPLNTSTASVFDSPTITAVDMPPPPPPHSKLPNAPTHHSPLSPHSSHASQLRHPSLSKTKSTPHLSTSLRHASASPPSIGDAKRGLEMAVSYLKSQGLGNDSADVAALRSVMMKMQVNQVSGNAGRSGSLSAGGMELPGGLHRIPEMELQGEDCEMGGVDVHEEY